MNTRRLFAGIEVDSSTALKGLMADLQREWRGERIRWVRAENLHLTIEFFGATAAERIPPLAGALAKAAAGAKAFELKLAGLGTFGSARHPRVVWLGIESAGLQALHDQVETALGEIGWTPEAREFAPHLTLGRIAWLKNGRSFTETIARHCDLAVQDQVVKELILFESVSRRYVPIGRWPLSEG